MTDYIVEFPLRTISLKLEDKAPTALESEGLNVYRRMHVWLWDAKLQWQMFRLQVAEIRQFVPIFDARAAEMETEIKRYGAAAGYSDEETEQFFPDGVLEYTLKPSHLQSLITEYGTLIDTYEISNKALNKVFKEVQEEYDELCEYHNYFDKEFFSPMLQDYERLQVDTASLYTDVDAFRGVWGEVDALRDEVIDEWNEISAELKVLNDKVMELDGRFIHLSQSINSANPTQMDNNNALLN